MDLFVVQLLQYILLFKYMCAFVKSDLINLLFICAGHWVRKCICRCKRLIMR